MRHARRVVEIDRWHSENSEPTSEQLAERAFASYARLYADDPESFGEAVSLWVGEAISLQAAAEIAIPLAHDVLDRGTFGEWVRQWFLEEGLERDKAVTILREALRDREEGAA